MLKHPLSEDVLISVYCCSRRGLTPPHRVKSISMATFTPEEVDFVKARGNDVSFINIVLKYCLSSIYNVLVNLSL